jgi:uncharacterized membrane-anchored protein YhcB (DUF1043 family)
MRLFFFLYTLFLILRSLGAVYFWLLASTTAPEDTTELVREVRALMEWMNNNMAMDIILLFVGLAGLAVSFGWGNWRLVFHRYYGKQKLKRLGQEAKRVAEDIANTISQERQRRNKSLEDSFQGLEGRARSLRETLDQDQRYLAKHMMESASIISRLTEVGYWRPSCHFHEIGIAGATGFAAEATCKELYTAADRIESDLEDGLMSLLTQPQLHQAPSKKRPR